MNFFKNFIKSAIDTSYYSNFAKESVGKAIVYLIILSILIGSIVTVLDIPNMYKVLNSVYDFVYSKTGDFKLVDGKLTMSSDMPVIIEEFDENGYRSIYLIDTTGRTTVDDLKDYNQYILITDTKYMIKSEFVENESKFPESNVAWTKDDMKKIVYIYLIFLTIIKFFLVIMQKFFVNVGVAMLISVLVLLIEIIRKKEIVYVEIFKISIYALTVPMLIKAIFNIISGYLVQIDKFDQWILINIGLGGFVTFVCAIIMIIIMVLASDRIVKNEELKIEDEIQDK